MYHQHMWSKYNVHLHLKKPGEKKSGVKYKVWFTVYSKQNYQLNVPYKNSNSGQVKPEPDLTQPNKVKRENM